jgi:DNA primase large subunit
MKLSFDRLKVLKKIEFMFGSDIDEKSMAEKIGKMTRHHKIAVQPLIYKDNRISTMFSIEDRIEFQENDNISHFICRLAYCRNEELRKWFITQETRLFSIRLMDFKPYFIKQLLESKLGIIYEELKATDKVWLDF